MLTISRDSDLFTAIIFVQISPDKQREVFELAVSATEEKIKHLPGFVAAAFYSSFDGTMVTEHVQWESKGHFDRALSTPELYEHINQVERIAEHVEFGPYEVRRVDVAGGGATPGKIVLSEGREPFTAVTRYKVEPENRIAFLDMLTCEPEHRLFGLPGFVGAALLECPGRDRVVEYLRFATGERLEAARRSSQARRHEAEVLKFALVDTLRCSVDHVSRGGAGPTHANNATVEGLPP